MQSKLNNLLRDYDNFSYTEDSLMLYGSNERYNCCIKQIINGINGVQHLCIGNLGLYTKNSKILMKIAYKLCIAQENISINNG